MFYMIGSFYSKPFYAGVYFFTLVITCCQGVFILCSHGG